MKSWSIQKRALMLALVPAGLIAIFLSVYFVADRFQELDENLRDRGQLIARQLATGAEYGLFSGNEEALRGLAENTLKEADVRGVLIASVNSDLEITVGKPRLLFVLPKDHKPYAYYSDDRSALVVAQPVNYTFVDLADIFTANETKEPVIGGWAYVELSTESLAASKRAFLLLSAGAVATVSVIGLLLALAISRGIVGPLRQMANMVTRIGGGDLTARAPELGDSDLGRLGHGLNEMAWQLQTAQSEMTKRIESATYEMAQGKAEAERANRDKSRFLAAASHDLRQPMHALGMFMELLTGKQHDPETQKLVGRVGQSVSAMGALLDALLDISRLDAGKVVPALTAINASDLILRIASDFEGECDKRGLRFWTHAQPLWVMSDPTLLERIIRNLLNNAVRYTERGTVMLAARRRGNALRIEVRDTGIGISEEDQGRIFEEFTQLANPERNREKGLGLGLSIVRRQAALLGHPMGLRSCKGHGATFWIEVPITAPQLPKSVPAEFGISNMAGRVIAVLDDDELVLSGMQALLDGWQCVVFGGNNRYQIEEALDSAGACPEVIICDHWLGDTEDGLAVISKLRKRYGAGIPAILMTGDTNPETVTMAGQLGLPVLHKPLRPARLRAAVAALLQEQEPPVS